MCISWVVCIAILDFYLSFTTPPDIRLYYAPNPELLRIPGIDIYIYFRWQADLKKNRKK